MVKRIVVLVLAGLVVSCGLFTRRVTIKERATYLRF